MDQIDWFDQIKLNESSKSKSGIPNQIKRIKVIFYNWLYSTNWVGQVDQIKLFAHTIYQFDHQSIDLV